MGNLKFKDNDKATNIMSVTSKPLDMPEEKIEYYNQFISWLNKNMDKSNSLADFPKMIARFEARILELSS
jgi:hypothetical protein